MPWNTTSSAVHNIENIAREDQTLSAHNSGYSWNATLQCHLHLCFMLILGSYRHRQNIFVKKIATEARNSTTHVQNDASVLSPGYFGHSLPYP